MVQHREADVPNLADVIGKRIVTTSLHHNVTIREENATAALEIMSRFAANPKWLVQLPPTMSPSETTKREGYLEYPSEAFAYNRKQGIECRCSSWRGGNATTGTRRRQLGPNHRLAPPLRPLTGSPSRLADARG